MRYSVFLLFFILLVIQSSFKAQLPVGIDTITVLENGKVLKSAWSGGLNSCEFSEIDLNLDGKKDIVVFDKVNYLAYGVLRSFINKGGLGQTNYVHDASYYNKFPAVNSWTFFYDYNNDGKADLFTYVLGGIQVYKNTSTPGNLSFVLKDYRLNSDFNPGGFPNFANIYASPVSLPAFYDVDKDGDMDILNFGATVIIDYHRNKSIELGYGADSLIYERYDDCWGDISENNCGVNLSQCVLKKIYEDAINPNQKVYHSGSCLMCFDRETDGDIDMILGDISCSYVNYLENQGIGSSNSHIYDTTKLYPNFPAKASTQIIKMNNFPCTYNLDTDNDGKKDLIASPNVSGSENYQSVWLYKNIGTATVADFQFVKKNFLQDEMIEVGEGAYPVLFDNDNDGLLDLVIGNLGYYNINNNFTKLTYYKNVGSLSQPTYSLITRDFANLSAIATASSMGSFIPTFGDIDSDGDIDMILGDAAGKIHWVENTAGAGVTCNFSIFKNNFFGLAAPTANAYPQLIDVNRDGKLDLITGRKSGRLYYYQNIGTATVPSYSLYSAAFGNVNVKGDPSLFGSDGNCAPFMFDVGGSYKLLCGSISGRIFYYDNIDGNLLGNFNQIDTNVNKIYLGNQSAVQYVDINGDGKRDLIVGNYSGGLSFYSSKSTIGINEIETNIAELVLVYPNPTNGIIFVKFKNNAIEKCELELMDICGKTVLKQFNEASYCNLNAEALSKGLYLLKINAFLNNQIKTIYKKIIVD